MLGVKIGTLRTPARVRISPLPTPTRKTAATFRQKATDAFVSRIIGEIWPTRVANVSAPLTLRGNSHGEALTVENRIERGHALRERDDAQVNDRADGRVVVQGHERVHLHPVEQDLDHDEPARLERDRGGLDEEAEEVEVELAAARERDAARDHEHDGAQLAVRLLEAEDPGDEEDGDGVECLEHLDVRDGEVEVRGVGEDERRAEEEANGQDGAHEHLLREVHILRAVEQICGTRENARAHRLWCQVSGVPPYRRAGRTHREAQMPCREEDGVLEPDGVVHVVVVNNDGRAEEHPNRNDRCRRHLKARFLAWRGHRRGQRLVQVLRLGAQVPGAPAGAAGAARAAAGAL